MNSSNEIPDNKNRSGLYKSKITQSAVEIMKNNPLINS
jgi:hypothetical protein